MFNHTYNASQVETEVVPTAAGRYTVIIDQVAEKISKNSGKDMLELKLKITAAEAPEHKRFVGRVLYVYIVDDQYADQILTVCKAFGFTRNPAEAEKIYIRRWFNDFGFRTSGMSGEIIDWFLDCGTIL